MGWERELKLRLDREGYRRLREALGPPLTREEQVNLYLDTPDGRLAACRCMLRLRETGGAWRLTFKEGVEVGGGYFQAREWEAPLEGDLWDLPPMRAVEERFGRFEPVTAGRVENERLHYPLPVGGVLELDRTTFPGGMEEYELEVETSDPDAARRYLNELCGPLGVHLEPQERTKYERFLAYRR